MGILHATMTKLAGEIRTAILMRPEKSYEAIAMEYQVSRSTVCKIARQLKNETGLQRRPRKAHADV